jgi:hypothetical protein
VALNLRADGGSLEPAVGNGPLVLASFETSTAQLCSPPHIVASYAGRASAKPVLRCILVNDANLKTEAHCAWCHKRIGESYLRQIASKLLFCDFDCYKCAEIPVLRLEPSIEPLKS